MIPQSYTEDLSGAEILKLNALVNTDLLFLILLHTYVFSLRFNIWEKEKRENLFPSC